MRVVTFDCTRLSRSAARVTPPSRTNFLVRGGACEAMEGHARERNVVVEFKDRATAFACYQSAEYQAARALRQKYADSDFVIVEGAA
jgi:uncharacterized protein (DUF1330 family)